MSFLKFPHILSLIGVAVCLSQALGIAHANDDEKPVMLKVDGQEATSKTYSFDRAVKFLDQTSQAWTSKHKCFTCHTNFAHLVAVADLKAKPRYFGDVKKSLDQLVSKRWTDKGPRWDAEVVMAAMTLALVDQATQPGKLSPATREALDRTWKVQRKDGGFDWLKCDWPPMESDDEYGAAIAAIAASAAPQDYQMTDAAKEGVRKLKLYIKEAGLKRLHNRALLIWAESLGGDWLSDEQTADVVQSLLELQNKDGGWNTASLGKWEREDGKPADTKTSDGYGTGFALFILRRAGKDKNDPAIARGIQWLKTNQRESGRWYTRSLSRDNKHYLTHAGTAMAIMALNACKD